jgi:hypothetical protein
MTADERGQKRRARLESLSVAGTDETACEALRQVHTGGSIRPDQIVIRSPFARLANRLDTSVYSDRRVPERHLRPPATRLIHSRGCVLQFYLTLLFEAQCRTRPGRQPGLNRRSLMPLPDAADLASWVDLIGASAATDRIVSGSRSINDRDRRLRQIRQALLTLASDTVQLVAFTDPRAKRRYQGFRLMHEAGRRAIGDPVPYVVPRPTERGLFSIDARMFTNGWIHVLTDTELAFLCMVADLQAHDGGTDAVSVPGDLRVGLYCLGTDGYQAHHLLSRAGLIQVKRPRGRRRDGTFKGYIPDIAEGVPHSFRIVSEGFAQPALRTVIRAL